MPLFFEHLHTVTPAEIDFQGHVSNEVYVRWLSEAAIAHSAAQGWPLEAYAALGSGWVVRKHEIEYLHPARVGDTLVIRTWVATIERATSLRRYVIKHQHGDERIAVACTLWAFVDLKTGRLTRIPARLASSFEARDTLG
ncbi:MAG: acyl-CoA thioesterase [Planctomycetota bacterium]|nr:acyl-CoA thioesterase [Planctomycetota bacterium]